MTRHLTAAIAALSLALPATAQTLPGGVLPGPLFPQPGSGSLFPGNGSLFPNSSMPQQHGNFGGGRHHGHGFGSGGFIIYEDQPEVVHDVVVVHDQPAAAPEPPPPAPPREPYVIGRTYASLPGGCLKMVEGGASFFHCSEGWYRQVGARFRAVARP
jgi:hypothetical protein